TTDFEEEVSFAERDYEQKIKEQQNAIEILSKEVADLKRSNSDLVTELDSSEEKNSTLEKQLREHDVIKRNMLVSIDTLTQENDMFSSEVKQLRKELDLTKLKLTDDSNADMQSSYMTLFKKLKEDLQILFTNFEENMSIKTHTISAQQKPTSSITGLVKTVISRNNPTYSSINEGGDAANNDTQITHDSSDESGQWKTIRYQQRGKRIGKKTRAEIEELPSITGKAEVEDDKFSAVTFHRRFWIHATHFSKDLTADDLKEHLDSKYGRSDFIVYKTNHHHPRPKFSSFKIGVDPVLQQTLLSPEQWSLGIKVREYIYHNKNRNNQSRNNQQMNSHSPITNDHHQKNIPHIELFLEERPTDVLCLTEHWLTKDNAGTLNIPGYKWASVYCRVNYKCGGTAILLKRNIQSEEVGEVKQFCVDKQFECSAVKCNIGGEKVIVLSIYRSPDSSVDGFLESLYNCLMCLEKPVKIDMTESGFVKAQSDNLPKIDAFMVAAFFANSPLYTSAEIRVIKADSAGRENYGDAALGYVQLKREGHLCTVKAKICPEHKVRNKNYLVTLVVNEQSETVEDVSCNDCPASSGGCKHAIAVLMWVHRRSEEPAATEIQCYWRKPTLSKIGTELKYITLESFGKAPQQQLPHPSNFVGLLLSSKFPFAGASPDASSDEYIVEVKCPTTPKTKELYIKDGMISNKYKAQLQLQMYFFKKLKGVFCVADPSFEINNEVEVTFIDYDEDYVMTLLEAAKLFWITNIFPVLKNSLTD
ncbi:unnamed protein product, partial [Callosobruchus maculatus]